MSKFDLISTDSELKNFVDHNRTTDLLAIDTEFVREKTFYPKLCLIQLATREQIVCIDVLSIAGLSALAELMFNSDCLKILHAGTQDLEVLYQVLGRVPEPLFDTQIAAGFCGFREQLGYGDLAEALCDIQLEKAHARFDWTTRPLPKKVLAYAADDVRYLLPIYEKLHTKLAESGRSEWQQHESALLTNPALYDQPIETAWTRVRGMNRLTDSQWGIACALASWREQTAQKENRPRQWVIRNETILEIAQQDSKIGDILTDIKSVPSKYVDEIMTAINEATDAQNFQRLPSPIRLDDQQRLKVRKLMTETQRLSTELDIPSTTLATRRDIENLVRGDPNPSLQTGWRKEIIGDHLLRLLVEE